MTELNETGGGMKEVNEMQMFNTDMLHDERVLTISSPSFTFHTVKWKQTNVYLTQVRFIYTQF